LKQPAALIGDAAAAQARAPPRRCAEARSVWPAKGRRDDPVSSRDDSPSKQPSASEHFDRLIHGFIEVRKLVFQVGGYLRQRFGRTGRREFDVPESQDLLDTCESYGAKGVFRLIQFGMCMVGKMVGERAIHSGSPEFTGDE
jgi:hypothetical protein